MKVLSGRQPWWWAILHAGKRIENRRWNTKYRGPILLHAAAGYTSGEVVEALDWMMARELVKYPDWPGLESVPRGGIVGRARIVDVIQPGSMFYPDGVDRRWHMPEQYGFVLADVEPLQFFPCKGALGLWSAEGLANLIDRVTDGAT